MSIPGNQAQIDFQSIVLDMIYERLLLEFSVVQKRTNAIRVSCYDDTTGKDFWLSIPVRIENPLGDVEG